MALTYDEIQSLTNKYIWPKVIDNAYKSNALFTRLYKKKVMVDGGEFLSIPLLYDDNDAQGSYSGYDVLSTTPNEQITAATFQWKQLYSTLAFSGLEMIKNSGKFAVVNLLKSKRDNCVASLKYMIGTQVHSDGTGNGSKDVTGLQAVIAATGTSYGGILDTDITSGLWLAKRDTSTTTLTLAAMTKLYGQATEDSNMPDLGITSQAVLDKYETLLQPQQRFTSSVEVDGGFHGLKFKGIPIVADSKTPGSGGGTEDNYLYFLNTKYLFWYTHPERDFYSRPKIEIATQDAFVEQKLIAGNIACNNRRFQAVMTTIDPNL